ncbi:MAG: hypothetical protein WCO12_01970 [bacterium]
MPLTTTSKIAIRLSVSIFIAVIVIGYSLFSARHIIAGPVITILSPSDGQTASDNFMEIKGESENLNYISMNDRQIFIDDKGNFKEKILLYPGYNTVKFYGKDKFGREITKYIRLTTPEDKYPTVAFSPPTNTTASSTLVGQTATSTHIKNL